MDKQKAADLLQEQLEKISALKEKNPDDSEFKLWNEDNLTIFNEFFSEEKRFLDSFYWYSFRVNRIKFAEEAGLFTDEDKDAYLKGLQDAEVTIKAALRKLELFGIKPQVKQSVSSEKGLTVKITNNLSNQQSVNLSITLDEVIQLIQNSEQSPEEKQEATSKINDLKEELEKEDPSWEKVKDVLVWLLNFSRDIFIKVLPYILDKYAKGN